MKLSTLHRWRHRSLVGSAAVLSVMSVLPAVSVAQASTTRGTSCPRAESLVPGTTWHNHKLAPGISLSEGQKKDGKGLVKMHVLRVDTTAKGVSFAPLLHRIAQRSPLSKLAAGHKHLVAAVNTGYFDFFTGAPIDPLINKRAALVLSKKHQQVVGIGTNGAWQSGSVWLAAAAFAAGKSFPVAAVNEARPPTGLSVYNPAWGGTRVPARSDSSVRPVNGNKIQASKRGGFGGVSMPSNGYLLVARGSQAQGWLAHVPSGTAIGIAAAVKTNAHHPFVQAYGDGAELVQKAGVVRTIFTCNSANTKQPARTAIGFANHGKTVVIAAVEDHPGTSIHGLDADQMSKLMVQLGVSKAFLLDGSGSTEMLARLRHASRVSLRTYPADGQERIMPLGLGIMSSTVG